MSEEDRSILERICSLKRSMLFKIQFVCTSSELHNRNPHAKACDELELTTKIAPNMAVEWCSLMPSPHARAKAHCVLFQTQASI